ncbi:MAG TPA: dihydrolipoyl dehydrogenase [Gemmataceae bacterium]|nr:dihydrolipoyl dehydrogenase [Gemmataceae bacterium]
MPETVPTQLLVLGGGPGGYAAAFHAADRGLKVTLIDAQERPGGTCLYVGCIPSKAVLHAAKLITDAREAGHAGLTFAPPKIDINGVRGHWMKVVDTLTGSLARLCKVRKVDYVQGRGRFVDPLTVQVDGGNSYRFENCILATGSVPVRPPFANLASNRIMDSTGALKLEEIPPRLLVIGGGYIGLEMGYVYAALGSKVTVVELLDGLLPGVDRDLVLPLSKRLEQLFDKIYLKTKVAKLEVTPKGIKATLEGEEVTDKEQVFERVLVAVGRRPNSRDLGLDKAGVEVDEKGFIKVNEQRRTSAERIFAIGDVAGEPMLAHKATYEGKVAAEVIAGEPSIYDARAVPAVVFTDPELAWCGLTETEAKRHQREVKVIRFSWLGSGRALTLGRTEGLTKLIVDPQSERVLGVGIVGVEAGEMIAEATLAIEMGATARDLALTIHAHPTLSESVMEAAELVSGSSTHHPPKKSPATA